MDLHDDIKNDFSSDQTSQVKIIIAAEEILLNEFAPELVSKIEARFPRAEFLFRNQSDSEVIQQVQGREVHLGIVSGDVPNALFTKSLRRIRFQTVVSKKHPLGKDRAQSVHVNKVLKYPFVVPERALFGQVQQNTSPDGWHDDEFPRIIKYRSGGLQLIKQWVESGKSGGLLARLFG